MKKVFVFLLGLASLLIIACEKQVDIEAEKAQVKSVLDQYFKVIETEDIELLSQLTAHDEDMVNFGTDAAERFVGWKSLKESFQKQCDAFDTAKISVRDRVIKISQSGTVAWYSVILDFKVKSHGKEISIEGVRSTGVLEKREGKWVFVQGHSSIPVSGQAVEY